MKNRNVLLVAALVGALSIGAGSSVAYFTRSETVTNNLSVIGPEGMNATLTEPSWDPEKGISLVPGVTIPKDPQITNTSTHDKMSEAVAVKVTFVYGKGCPDKSLIGKPVSSEYMGQISSIYTIDWATDNGWVRFDGDKATDNSQRFYYGDIIAPGEKTAPLFTSVSVDEKVGNSQYRPVQDMGGFDIRIEGYAVQQITDSTADTNQLAKEAYEAGLFKFE